MNLDEYLRFEGVSRTILEERVRRLVGTVRDLESRVAGRKHSNRLSSDTHPDPDTRARALVRSIAYDVVLGDLRDILLRDVHEISTGLLPALDGVSAPDTR